MPYTVREPGESPEAGEFELLYENYDSPQSANIRNSGAADDLKDGDGWRLGVSLLAPRLQRLNDGFFMANGRTGYRLKPKDIRQGLVPEVGLVPVQRVTVRVLSGFNLPRTDASLFVELSLIDPTFMQHTDENASTRSRSTISCSRSEAAGRGVYQHPRWEYTTSFDYRTSNLTLTLTLT